MHLAVIEDDCGMVRYFLQNNPDLTKICDKDNHSPLSLAIKLRRYYIIRVMLMNGVDTEIGG